MKDLFFCISLFFFVTGCSKRQDKKITNDGLTGKWKLSERFWSPGSGGSWHPVPAEEQFVIEFSNDREFSYSPNFFKADSLFNRYVLTDNTVAVSSSLNNKTNTWYIHFVDGKRLDISLVTCIEGCPFRFVSIK